MGRKLGVLGGTFDPIHLGHLVLAERAREQLELDRVLFVPAALPPHKQSKTITDARHRLEMVRLAIAGNSAFEACDIELVREGVSYSFETLRRLGEKNPGDVLHLLIGADNAPDLPHWKSPEEIARLAKICIARRPGSKLRTELLALPFSEEQIAEMSSSEIQIPLLEISSSEIRRRIALGRSIRYLVTPAVEAYIQAQRLYMGVTR